MRCCRPPWALLPRLSLTRRRRTAHKMVYFLQVFLTERLASRQSGTSSCAFWYLSGSSCMKLRVPLPDGQHGRSAAVLGCIPEGMLKASPKCMQGQDLAGEEGSPCHWFQCLHVADRQHAAPLHQRLNGFLKSATTTAFSPRGAKSPFPPKLSGCQTSPSPFSEVLS